CSAAGLALCYTAPLGCISCSWPQESQDDLAPQLYMHGLMEALNSPIGVVEQALCQNNGNTLLFPVSFPEAPLPASKPLVISLLESGEDPWIPDVHSPDYMPEDHRPGEVVEGRRQLGLECLKKPLGKHSGKKGRNHLGFNTGQRGPEEPRSRQACQKKKQKRCTECGKSFKSYSRFISNLTHHKAIHIEDRRYKCPKYVKSFRIISDLILHQCIHTGERPFQCPDYGKRFKASSYVICHKLIHTGGKPFKCSGCDYQFPIHHLIQYWHIHSGDKPFKCIECGKSFKWSYHVILH
uniref:C2H2-type domain-containing protein n=1 Tax=Coturnix japonica TaxID=93934 RepID=A0A8C2SLF1_COTJA